MGLFGVKTGGERPKNGVLGSQNQEGDSKNGLFWPQNWGGKPLKWGFGAS